MQAISITGLVKQYKSLTAVDQLHLDIGQGELFSLLGINGAGKTTVIKMLSCLTRPTAGDALVGGYSIVKQPEKVKRLIGVSPQETAVAPNLSVRENLELICGYLGVLLPRYHLYRIAKHHRFFRVFPCLHFGR